MAFGKFFIANPDLHARFAKGAALNRPEQNTFHAPGPHGYVDYPALTVEQLVGIFPEPLNALYTVSASYV